MLEVCGAGESGSGRAEKKKNIFAFRFGEEKKDVDLCTPKQKRGEFDPRKSSKQWNEIGGRMVKI